MSLLTVVRDVCAVVGVVAPTSVFANTNRTMFEMVANANEMAQRIAYDTRDWTALRTTTTFNGDGVLTGPPPDPPEILGTTAWNLPADYKRLLLTSNVWCSTSMQQPVRFISDADEWVRRRLANHTDGWGEWTLLGGKMHIVPVMMVGTSASFVYLDKNCVQLTSGGRGDRFMEDTDSFVLDERLLKLGMIWNWKKDKGSPYAENMGEYSDAIANAMGHDQPAPILSDRPLLANGGWSNAILG